MRKDQLINTYLHLTDYIIPHGCCGNTVKTWFHGSYLWNIRFNLNKFQFNYFIPPLVSNTASLHNASKVSKEMENQGKKIF